MFPVIKNEAIGARSRTDDSSDNDFLEDLEQNLFQQSQEFSPSLQSRPTRLKTKKDIKLKSTDKINSSDVTGSESVDTSPASDTNTTSTKEKSPRKIVRKRTGCLKCKQERPICKNCKRLGSECNYSRRLVFLPNCRSVFDKENGFSLGVGAEESGSIVQEHRLGRHRHTGEPLHFLNTIFLDLGLLNSNDNQGDSYSDIQAADSSVDALASVSTNPHETADMESILPSFSFSPVIKQPLNTFGFLTSSDTAIDDTSSFLMEYYVKAVSRRRVFSDSVGNEFRTIVLPTSSQSESLLTSVFAVAANDLARRDQNRAEYFAKLTVYYKSKALTFLRQALGKVDWIKSLDRDTIVVTILMLCALEISDQANKNWISHLQGARQIFRLIDTDTIMESSPLLFAYRYFTLRYILLCTTMDEDDYTECLTQTPWPYIDRFFDDETIDPLLGCSPKLTLIISDITDLSYRASQSLKMDYTLDVLEDVRNSLFRIKDELKRRLNSLEQKGDCNLDLLLCSKAYYHAAHIYLQSSLSCMADIHMSYGSHLSHLVNVLEELSSKIDRLNLFPCWALFMACTVITNDNDRLRFMNEFDILEAKWPAASLSQTRRAVECLWKNRDLLFDEKRSPKIGPCAQDTSNMFQWRKVLSDAGFKLALT